MSKKTSNIKDVSETPNFMGDYVDSEDKTYREEKLVNTISPTGVFIELHTAYCKENSACDIKIEVDFNKIEMRETIYRLNQKIKEQE